MSPQFGDQVARMPHLCAICVPGHIEILGLASLFWKSNSSGKATLALWLIESIDYRGWDEKREFLV
jgi:hypothetical protein